MSQISHILLKGLVAILPIGMTIYLIYWLGITTETVLAGPIRWFVPAESYVPGMGLAAGFVVLFIAGLLVNAYVVRRSMHLVEALVMRVPVVKTVYGALRDVTRLVNTDGRKGDLERVVMVDIGPGRVIGFVTQEHASLPGSAAAEDLIAVYLPMSYQIGGYTLYLPRSRIEPIDLSVEAAMRIVLTGGLQR
ncbi:MAG: hypothetical protein AMXMBFR45_04910 [Gammaproteobacteria bacterium]|nr:DUF502 domain-containing protein [Gammaproteobacteria bacterium]MCE7896738.1 DUF502 domain-containing protein [Gammaproteobacteria bacterium PRO8]MCL4777147.1 DUF502 domain-containing protein [Gammaproteobacteria bacterium]MDL1880611.1 DUF502 domain-containing protein [Gammaproteobacteria bacterium PRO2]